MHKNVLKKPLSSKELITIGRKRLRDVLLYITFMESICAFHENYSYNPVFALKRFVLKILFGVQKKFHLKPAI